jgi:hypothetical protein
LTRAPDTLARRLFWFAALWLAGVASVGALAYALRWMLTP